MKTVCDFCKTEYALDAVPTGPVKCAVCGHTWVVPRPARSNSVLVFIASLCALLSAIVFALVVCYTDKRHEIQNHPLVSELNEVTRVTDESGAEHFQITGRVVIYGVPGLVVVSYDSDDNVIARQRFMPPATLLDAGDDVSFTHVLSVPIDNVDKIRVTLETMGD